MSRFMKLYQALLNKYPYSVQIAQTGVLMGSGDVIAQAIIERRPWADYNFRRTLSYAAIGTFFVGPVLSRWYAILQKNFGHQKYAVFKKVAVDQIFMAPVLITSIVSISGVLQSRKMLEIKEQLKTDFKDILMTNYKLWPWVQLINFYAVPLYYQLLVVQIVALIWNTYLCWKIESTKSLKME